MSDGVSESDIRSALQAAEKDANRVDTTTDKTEEMKVSVLEQAKLAETAVQNAFRADDRGLQY
jgi:hypothetical protein